MVNLIEQELKETPTTGNLIEDELKEGGAITPSTQTGSTQVTPPSANLIEQELLAPTEKPQRDLIESTVPLAIDIGGKTPTSDELETSMMDEFFIGEAITFERAKNMAQEQMLALGATFANLTGGFDPDNLADAEALIEQEDKIKASEAELNSFIEQGANSTGGQFARDFGRLFSGSALIGLGLAEVGLGAAAATYVGTAFGDLVAFRGDEKRISNLVSDLADQEDAGLAVRGLSVITDSLKADPNTGDFRAKFNQLLEGFILGEIAGQTFKTAARTAAVTGQATGRLSVNVLRQLGEVGETVVQKTQAAKHSSPGTLTTPKFFQPPPEQAALSSIDTVVTREADDLLRQPFKRGAVGAENEKRIGILTQAMEAKIRKADPEGLLTQPDIDNKLKVFEKTARKKHLPVKSTVEGSNAMREGFQESMSAQTKARSFFTNFFSPSNKIEAERLLGFDASGPLLRRVVKEGGAEGQALVDRFDLIAGSPGYIDNMLGHYRDRVFPLKATQRENNLVTELVMLRNLRGIKLRTPDYNAPIGVSPAMQKQFGKDAGKKLTARQLDDTMDEMRIDIGEETFAKINERSDAFFEVAREGLRHLRNDGVITAEEHVALSRFDFAPTEYLDELGFDEIMIPGRGNKVTTVRSNGIRSLGKGQEAFALQDPQYFMSQILHRSVKTARKNKLNQDLHKLAKAGELSFATTKRPKTNRKDWAEINAMFDGKPKKIWMQKDFAKQWNVDNGGLLLSGNWASKATGTELVKFGATGAGSPDFFMVAFPRDIFYSWFGAMQNNQRMYSSFLPKGLTELGVDLVQTAKDNFSRTGAYQEALEAGSFAHLIADQSRLAQKGLAKQATKADRYAENVEGGLNWLNSHFETWTRLSIRNRHLKLNPDDIVGANAAARRVLDYSKGGKIHKDINQIVPYWNVALQSFRSPVRAFAKDPKSATAASLNMMALFGSAYLSNNYLSDKQWKELPAYKRARSLIFTLPWKTQDRDGNTINMTIEWPLDHVMMPLKATADSLMDHQLGVEREDISFGDITKAAVTAFPVESPVPPLVNAWASLSLGIDPFTGRTIDPRSKEQLLPEDRFKTPLETERPTSLLSRDIAKTVNPTLRNFGLAKEGVSPARLDSAVRAMFGPNIFNDMAGEGYNDFRRATDPVLKADPAEQEKFLRDTNVDNLDDFIGGEMFRLLQEAPFSRKIFGRTNPAYLTDAESVRAMEERSEDFKIKNGMLVRYDVERETNLTQKIKRPKFATVEEYIRSAPALERPKLLKSFERVRQMDNAFDSIKVGVFDSIPQRKAWKLQLIQPVHTRANWLIDNVLLEIARSNDMGTPEKSKEARNSARAAKRILSSVNGFKVSKDTEFGKALHVELLDRGLKLNPQTLLVSEIKHR